MAGEARTDMQPDESTLGSSSSFACGKVWGASISKRLSESNFRMGQQKTNEARSSEDGLPEDIERALVARPSGVESKYNERGLL